MCVGVRVWACNIASFPKAHDTFHFSVIVQMGLVCVEGSDQYCGYKVAYEH